MNIIDLCKDIEGIELALNVNLEKYTTIRLEARGDVITVFNIDALKKLLPKLNKNQYKYNIVGWGANQVLYNTKSVVFIHLKFPFDANYLSQPRNEYILPASVSLNVLTLHAKKFGLKGWEVFTGIPASLGGAIFMNAGTGLGEIGKYVKSVKIVKTDGTIKEVITDKNSFAYRENHFVAAGEVIIEAVLIHEGIDEMVKAKIQEYLDFRKATQPITTKNCGCVFKNHSMNHRAGHHIDVLGLKGLNYRGLEVSLLHANFIENQSNAKADDFIKLIKLIQEELELQTGIMFEFEVKVY